MSYLFSGTYGSERRNTRGFVRRSCSPHERIVQYRHNPGTYEVLLTVPPCVVAVDGIDKAR